MILNYIIGKSLHKIMNNLKFVFIFVLLILCFANNSYAQNSADNRKVQLAISYERYGDYEKALGLYMELYRSYPMNHAFMNGVKRNLELLKRYDELINILRKEVLAKPNDINLLGKLSEIYFLVGNRKKAESTWAQIVNINPANGFNYIYVAGIQSRMRLFDDAINTLLKGKSTGIDPALLSRDLARLYIWRRNFPEAAEELLSLLIRRPKDYPQIEVQILNIPDESEIVDKISAILKKHHSGNPGELNILKMLAHYLTKNRKYEDAFDYILKYDNLTKSKGAVVLNFSIQFFNNKAYSAAEKTLKYYLNNYPKGRDIPRAEYFHAYSLEMLDLERLTGLNTEKSSGLPSGERSETRLETREAIPAYESLIAKYPGSQWAAQSYYRLGEIYYKTVFDLDKAIRSYKQITRILPNIPIDISGKFQTAECYLMKGNLKSAETIFGSLSKFRHRWGQETKEKSLLKLADIEFYKGNITEAKNLYDKLCKSGSANRNVVNDALERIIFIEENSSDEIVPIKLYAETEFYITQRRFGEALNNLIEILTKYSGAPIIDDTFFELGMLSRKMKKFDDAVKYFNEIIEKFPETSICEKSHLELGSIFQNDLSDFKKAEQLYSDFLLKFPDSVYIDEVRSRIRKIRSASNTS